MELTFYKYQGAGNDFICLDDRSGALVDRLDQPAVAALCDRRFGIGADGLMLLAAARDPLDFAMDYFNADGRRSTMCGNGGRCIVRFARDLGIDRQTYRFLAVDGPHEAAILPDGLVSLGMNDVVDVKDVSGDLELDTGSPHYLRFVEDLAQVDVVTEGRSLRRSAAYLKDGINVNFVQEAKDGLRIATYERGVEDETLACGTGVTAAAVGHLHRQSAFAEGNFRLRVAARGGTLYVSGRKDGGLYTDLRLIGPATFVFQGTINL